MVKKAGPGSFHFPEDFIEVANDEQVRLALSRLAKEKMVMRLARGIYYYPKQDPYIGSVNPSLERIAEVIATRDRVKIRPTGAHALNKLGLSTQVPMKIAYFTSGPKRIIKVGSRTIQFINKSPRKMAYEGLTSGPVLTALMELGKNNLTDEMLAKILPLLKQEIPEILLNDLKLAPKWIAQTFIPLMNDKLQFN
jgi:hypothetical protein